MGVHLDRAFGFGEPSQSDPSLLFDNFRSDDPALYKNGFTRYPNRGIETINYMLEGEVEHGDSLGSQGPLGPGSAHWMISGSGMVHQKMHRENTTGQIHGFQLLANLPSALEMAAPGYQTIREQRHFGGG